MSVGLQTKYYWFTIGSGDFLHSFFSTIAFHLENGEWGSRFPHIMSELYNGELELQRINEAMYELRQIKKEMAKFSPSDVVWDIEDMDAKPPWGNNISTSITSLANYFVTSEGEDLFEVFDAAFSMAIEIGEPIRIVAL